jgi:hypothetical protein
MHNDARPCGSHAEQQVTIVSMKGSRGALAQTAGSLEDGLPNRDAIARNAEANLLGKKVAVLEHLDQVLGADMGGDRLARSKIQR